MRRLSGCDTPTPDPTGYDSDETGPTSRRTFWCLKRQFRCRVAKFESKIGSRRTTKIGNLVVLDIYMVALILIPYNMQFVLSYQNDICLLKKERVRIKSLKNLYEKLFSKYFPQNIW